MVRAYRASPKPPNRHHSCNVSWLTAAPEADTVVRHHLPVSSMSKDQWHSSACILCELNCGIKVQTGGVIAIVK